MLRVDERRIKGREIRSPGIVGIFEGAERGVNTESAEHNDHGEDLYPPGVAAQGAAETRFRQRSEEHTSELQSRLHLVCRLLLEKKKNPIHTSTTATVPLRRY